MSCQTFTQVLFDLATRPEYVQPMRDEVESVIEEEGWSKAAVDKLRKLDSFVKESLRLSPISSCMFFVEIDRNSEHSLLDSK
jgi:cytochrome P450